MASEPAKKGNNVAKKSGVNPKIPKHPKGEAESSAAVNSRPARAPAATEKRSLQVPPEEESGAVKSTGTSRTSSPRSSRSSQYASRRNSQNVDLTSNRRGSQNNSRRNSRVVVEQESVARVMGDRRGSQNNSRRTSLITTASSKRSSKSDQGRLATRAESSDEESEEKILFTIPHQVDSKQTQKSSGKHQNHHDANSDDESGHRGVVDDEEDGYERVFVPANDLDSPAGPSIANFTDRLHDQSGINVHAVLHTNTISNQITAPFADSSDDDADAASTKPTRRAVSSSDEDHAPAGDSSDDEVGDLQSSNAAQYQLAETPQPVVTHSEVVPKPVEYAPPVYEQQFEQVQPPVQTQVVAQPTDPEVDPEPNPDPDPEDSGFLVTDEDKSLMRQADTEGWESTDQAPIKESLFSSGFVYFNLKVIYEPNRTGFQASKKFPIRVGALIAGRYRITRYIGFAAFSKAVQCYDLQAKRKVCIKIINNEKDYIDQSMDEIKILKLLNSRDQPGAKNILRLYDYFYFHEHLFLVMELLQQNLYEFSKKERYRLQALRDAEHANDPHYDPRAYVPMALHPTFYFDFPNLRRIAKQVLVSLEFINSLRLIHCDLKPENILFKSSERGEVRMIDFGSSCFYTDHLSSYVQSRSYRSPEVILGLPYGPAIDVWSLGCVLAELYTGKVLFSTHATPVVLARIIGIMGEFPEDMLERGRFVDKFFIKKPLEPSSSYYQYVPPPVVDPMISAVAESDSDDESPPKRSSIDVMPYPAVAPAIIPATVSAIPQQMHPTPPKIPSKKPTPVKEPVSAPEPVVNGTTEKVDDKKDDKKKKKARKKAQAKKNKKAKSKQPDGSGVSPIPEEEEPDDEQKSSTKTKPKPNKKEPKVKPEPPLPPPPPPPPPPPLPQRPRYRYILYEYDESGNASYLYPKKSSLAHQLGLTHYVMPQAPPGPYHHAYYPYPPDDYRRKGYLSGRASPIYSYDLHYASQAPSPEHSRPIASSVPPPPQVKSKAPILSSLSISDEKDPDPDKAKKEDAILFIDFLTQLLQLRPETRLTPTEALKHPFLMDREERRKLARESKRKTSRQ